MEAHDLQKRHTTGGAGTPSIYARTRHTFISCSFNMYWLDVASSYNVPTWNRLAALFFSPTRPDFHTMVRKYPHISYCTAPGLMYLHVTEGARVWFVGRQTALWCRASDSWVTSPLLFFWGGAHIEQIVLFQCCGGCSPPFGLVKTPSSS